MRETIAMMYQLQELEIVHQESNIVHERGPRPEEFEQVEEQIRQLRQRIPDGYLRRFDTLRRNGPAVVREQDGVCTGCRINMNVGDINRMRKNQMSHVCPNCGRFLLTSPTNQDTGKQTV